MVYQKVAVKLDGAALAAKIKAEVRREVSELVVPAPRSYFSRSPSV